MAPIKVGLLGMGTIGGGTISVLTRNAQEIARRVGRGFEISHAAALNYDADSIQGLEQIGRITDDAFAVVNDPEPEIIIELIGGTSPAKELVLQAMTNGKHVVTANKALIAMHGNEIFAAARRQGVNIAFEAAVAGGVPIIKVLREGLVANRIQWVAGIINGTGNYILTEMKEKDRDFAAILQEAQALGYAEADPTFDIEGIDAAHKLTIISALAFGIALQFDKTYIEGITMIEPQDLIYAEELGYCIKHLGIARQSDHGIEMRVHPTLIPANRLLAKVNGVMNAVLVKGDAVGPTLYYGAGAGAEPTASAVIADLIDLARNLALPPAHRVPYLAYQPEQLADLPVLPIEQVKTANYLRMQVLDRPGVLAEISKILGDFGISIEAILQKEPHSQAETSQVPVVMLSQQVQEKNMNEAIDKIGKLTAVTGDIVRIRVETLA